jgi:hypothetical protein
MSTVITIVAPTVLNLKKKAYDYVAISRSTAKIILVPYVQLYEI